MSFFFLAHCQKERNQRVLFKPDFDFDLSTLIAFVLFWLLLLLYRFNGTIAWSTERREKRGFEPKLERKKKGALERRLQISIVGTVRCCPFLLFLYISLGKEGSVRTYDTLVKSFEENKYGFKFFHMDVLFSPPLFPPFLPTYFAFFFYLSFIFLFSIVLALFVIFVLGVGYTGLSLWRLLFLRHGTQASGLIYLYFFTLSFNITLVFPTCSTLLFFPFQIASSLSHFVVYFLKNVLGMCGYILCTLSM